jgi:hypothetical protein
VQNTVAAPVTVSRRSMDPSPALPLPPCMAHSQPMGWVCTLYHYAA